MCPYPCMAMGLQSLEWARRGRRGVDAHSWCSVLGVGSTFEKVCAIAMLSDLYTTAETKAQCWSLLVWPLKWLCIGAWPTEDVHGRPYQAGEPASEKAGQPLAGGYYACLYVLRGDLDWYAKIFNFPRWNSANPCGL